MPASDLLIPEVEKRVDTLLGQTTLDEKVGQMNQGMLTDRDLSETIQRGGVGSVIFATSAWAGKDMPYQPEAPHKIAVLGPLANAQGELFGSCTLDGQWRDVTSTASAIRAAAPAQCEVILPGGQHQLVEVVYDLGMSIVLVVQDLSFTRFDGSWGCEPGRFDVWVGPDSARGLQGEFEL